MGHIISASRRTDIPAFFAEWLLRRLEAGQCAWWHPFARRWQTVSLRPQDVVGLVLWTKNLGPLQPHLPWIRQRMVFYVQFTITGYGPPLERGVIPTEEAVRQATALARDFGSTVVVWRFDPIVHTQDITPSDTLQRFRRLCRELEGATNRCVISFMAPYRRQQRAFTRLGLVWSEDSPQLRLELAQEIAAIAAGHGMSVEVCCGRDATGGAVREARCIDPTLLGELGAAGTGGLPRGPSRPGCNCARAVDIGAYDLCGGECAYCYANQEPTLAARNRERHQPTHVGLAQACVTGPPADSSVDVGVG